MCKRLCLLALVITLMILSGCAPQKTLSDHEAGVYSRLHKKFSKMNSYSATVRLTVKGNKTENIYVMTQQVQEPDSAVISLTEPATLAGLTTILSAGQASVSAFPDEAALTVPAADILQNVLINNFFSIYYQSEETALSVSSPAAAESGTVLLETAVIPETSEHYKLALLFDAQKLEPKSLTVYDVGGNIRMIAEFSDFIYNPSFDSEIFMIQ